MSAAQIVPIEPRPRRDFVETPFIRGIVERGMTYLQSGFPINLSGPSGIGKTTLALHIAAQMGRPVVLMQGDEQLRSSDLIGGMTGYRHKRVVDNFIHSVLKTEEDLSQRWIESRLSTACKYGYTLVYDEFTRSRPEANNVLLAILEEGILLTPPAFGGAGFSKVHPEFNAIFTSNPEEYAGVYQSQDALRDRMIMLHLSCYDEETEAAIAAAKSGITREEANLIVKLVKKIRTDDRIALRPSIRATIAIAKLLASTGLRMNLGDHRVRQMVIDVMASHLNGQALSENPIGVLGKIFGEIEVDGLGHCGSLKSEEVCG